MNKLVVLLVMLVFPIIGRCQSSSDYGKASFLARACRDAVRTLDTPNAPWGQASYCMGFFDSFLSFMDKETFHVCLPPHTKATIFRVYIKWMDDHPKAFDTDPTQSAYAALLDNYPCPKAPETP